MSVQFVLGTSGTGKTRFCINSIIDCLVESGDKDGRLVLLVPEQASYQAERMILSDERIKGYSRLHVLSFNRLAFLLSGKNNFQPNISHIGRQMIIHRLLRENKGRLKVLGNFVESVGLSSQMADAVSQLNRYADIVEIEQLSQRLTEETAETGANLKFADIALVSGEYQKFIEGSFIDPDIQLRQVCNAIGQADILCGAKLWIDGFSGFTGSELAVLGELLKAACETQIALCLDAGKIDLSGNTTETIVAAGLFYPVEKTYAQLCRIIRECKLHLTKPVLLDKAMRFSESDSLAHIECNIFAGEKQSGLKTNDIKIVSTANIRGEVRFVAGQICQLIKEKGLRYRDIAVIASDINQYEHLIRAYFEDFGIAYFIDKPQQLNQHPAAGVICCALRIVTEGFLSSDIFSYLKSGLVHIDKDDIDLLENYCIAFAVTGDGWKQNKDWKFDDKNQPRFDEEQVNKTRRDAVEPLLELCEKLVGKAGSSKKITAGDFVRGIFEFIERLEVRGTISEWINIAVEEKDFNSVDRHQQFYDRLVDIFDQIVTIFADEPMSCEAFFRITESAFSQLTLAFIPPTLDQVLVGSIERSRHPDLKAVFLIGVTQKQFPSPILYNSLITDDIRDAAQAAGLYLGEGTSQSLAERQYLAYIAFTRACKYLCVSYPAVDEKGKSVIRSEFVTQLQDLFEGLKEDIAGDQNVTLDHVVSQGQLAGLLCEKLGKDVFSCADKSMAEKLSGLLADICGQKQFASIGAKIKKAINYDNKAVLEKSIVKKIFGKVINSSATRIGSFAACPYQYFARYILALEKRSEFKISALDLGNFYHRVLDMVITKVNFEKQDFTALSSDRIIEIVRQQANELIKEDSFFSSFTAYSPHNTFIIEQGVENLEDCAAAILEMVKAGDFRPVFSEVSFGLNKKSDKLSGYRIDLPDGRELVLRGKIDRLDTVEIEGQKTGVIFDFKKKAKAFSWSKFYYGLDMQLAIYMLAAEGSMMAEKIVGAFYMPVEGKIETGDKEKFAYKAKGIFDGQFAGQLDFNVKSGWSKFYNFSVSSEDGQYGNYSKSGALKPEDFEKVLSFAREKIAELAEQMTAGRIEVRPYRLSGSVPCSFCDYKSVCRFDWQINSYEQLETHGKSEVLQKEQTNV